jgi:hypothetical protein
MHSKFLSENMNRRDHSEDVCVYETILVRMDLREMRWEGVDWMHLAPGRGQWLDLVNKIMDLRVP